MSQTYAPAYPIFVPPPRPAPGQTDSFLAYMQDGKIFRQAPDGPQAIGVTTKTHEDLQADYDSIYATCKEYYDALVKAGVITPEPTQEELLRRQAEQLKAQAEQLAEARRVIEEGAANQQALSAMMADLHGAGWPPSPPRPALKRDPVDAPAVNLYRLGVFSTKSPAREGSCTSTKWFRSRATFRPSSARVTASRPRCSRTSWMPTPLTAGNFTASTT